jgi:adenosylmethionine-8-amino-7-oxononanoate aminotransferase
MGLCEIRRHSFVQEKRALGNRIGIYMTELPNSMAARDVSHVLHPYTNARRHSTNGPLIIERGEGVYVFDDQGKRYLEGMAGLWSAAVGFGEKRLVEAESKWRSCLFIIPLGTNRMAHRSI